MGLLEVRHHWLSSVTISGFLGSLFLVAPACGSPAFLSIAFSLSMYPAFVSSSCKARLIMYFVIIRWSNATCASLVWGWCIPAGSLIPQVLLSTADDLLIWDSTSFQAAPSSPDFIHSYASPTPVHCGPWLASISKWLPADQSSKIGIMLDRPIKHQLMMNILVNTHSDLDLCCFQIWHSYPPFSPLHYFRMMNRFFSLQNQEESDASSNQPSANAYEKETQNEAWCMGGNQPPWIMFPGWNCIHRLEGSESPSPEPSLSVYRHLSMLETRTGLHDSPDFICTQSDLWNGVETWIYISMDGLLASTACHTHHLV